MSLMALRKDVDVKSYQLLQTHKPIDTSLPDMGISLTGKVIIDIDYKKESVWSNLFFNTLLPLALLIGVLSLGMRMISKK